MSEDLAPDSSAAPPRLLPFAANTGWWYFGWWAVVGLALATVAGVSPYLAFDVQRFTFDEQREVFAANLLPFYAHVVGGVVAILIGPLQFASRIRDRNLGLHRWLGRVYLAVVGVGGIGGLAMAPVAYGGLSARVGFAMLAVLWLLSGTIAYLRILARATVAAHRRWMTRCYALTPLPLRRCACGSGW